jgi:hypothetical protein
VVFIIFLNFSLCLKERFKWPHMFIIFQLQPSPNYFLFNNNSNIMFTNSRNCSQHTQSHCEYARDFLASIFSHQFLIIFRNERKTCALTMKIHQTWCLCFFFIHGHDPLWMSFMCWALTWWWCHFLYAFVYRNLSSIDY